MSQQQNTCDKNVTNNPSLICIYYSSKNQQGVNCDTFKTVEKKAAHKVKKNRGT